MKLLGFLYSGLSKLNHSLASQNKSFFVKGFTIIEMSVVLIIAGILTMAVGTYYESTANDAQATDVAHELMTAEAGLRKFVIDNYSEYALPASAIGVPAYNVNTNTYFTTPTPIISGVANIIHPTSTELKRLGYLDASIGEWIFTIKNDDSVGFDYSGNPLNQYQLHCHHNIAVGNSLTPTNSGCDFILMGQKPLPFLNTDGVTANYGLLSKIVNIVGGIAGYSAAMMGNTSSNDGRSIRGANNEWRMDILDSTGKQLPQYYSGATIYNCTLNGSPWITTADPVFVTYLLTLYPTNWVACPATYRTGDFSGYLGFFSTVHTSNYRTMIKNQLESRTIDTLNGVSVAGHTSLQNTGNAGVLLTLDGIDASGVPVTGQFNSVGLISSLNTLSSSINTVDQSCSTTSLGALSKNIAGLPLSCIQSPTQGMVWKLTSEIACPSGGALVTLSKPVVIPFGCNNVQIIAMGGAGGGAGGQGGGSVWYNCIASFMGSCILSIPANGYDGGPGLGGNIGASASLSLPYGTVAGKMLYIDIGLGGQGGAGGGSNTMIGNGGSPGNPGSGTTISDVNGNAILYAPGGSGGGANGVNGQDALVTSPALYAPFAAFISPGGAVGAQGTQTGLFQSIINTIANSIQSVFQIIGGIIGGALNTITGLFGQSAGFPTSGSNTGAASEDGSSGAGGAMAAGGGGGGGGAAGMVISTRWNGGLGGVGGPGGSGYAIIVWTK